MVEWSVLEHEICLKASIVCFFRGKASIVNELIFVDRESKLHIIFLCHHILVYISNLNFISMSCILLSRNQRCSHHMRPIIITIAFVAQLLSCFFHHPPGTCKFIFLYTMKS